MSDGNFFLLAGNCLDIGLYGLDIGLDFWARLCFLEANPGPCRAWEGALCKISLMLSDVY